MQNAIHPQLRLLIEINKNNAFQQVDFVVKQFFKQFEREHTKRRSRENGLVILG